MVFDILATFTLDILAIIYPQPRREEGKREGEGEREETEEARRFGRSEGRLREERGSGVVERFLRRDQDKCLVLS